MEYIFSKSANNMRSSAIRNILSLAVRPDIISFAGGMPGDELFPTDDLRELVATLTEKQLQESMQYGQTSGYPPLIEELKKWLRAKGFPVDTNRLIITTGSLQAINIIGKIFINPGDVVLTENPVFIGATSAFKSFEATIVGIPMDEEGIEMEALKQALALNPKFIYVTPNFHNPAGLSYSKERRRQFLELLAETNVPILEDDAYAELFYDADIQSVIVPMKTTAKNEQQYFYSGSFSKVFGPGLRVGWLLVPEAVYAKAEVCKQSMDACSPMLSQVLAYEFLRTGKMQIYIEKLRAIYKLRRDCMLTAIRNECPIEATFVEPKGGFYLWLKMPQGVDEEVLVLNCVKEGVVFVTGKTFDPDELPNGYIRLSFSNTPEEQIKKGISVLANELKKMM
ncbi:MAG TPA: PLP-dependent aminotransferase family protein [Paludibacteraceae bacterium]|nr:PLP-dependent aminotransferase family protein [Paludibacteraceae bacterium]